MKIVVLGIFCVCININIHAQKYFSKMFDIYGHWESFTNVVTMDSGLVLAGISRNFFVADSSRFNSLFLTSLNKNFSIIKETKIAKNFQNLSTFIPINGFKNKFVYGLIDTNQNVKYFIINVSNELNFSDNKPIKFLDKTSLTCFPINNLNNKLYFWASDYTNNVASKLKLSMQCMDTNGNLLWGKIFQNKRCYTINAAQTKDGNFILAGLKYYGESLGAQDSAFAWYAKVDTLGNILWEKDLIRGSPFLCDDLWASNANGDIYLSGSLLAFQGNTPIDLHRDSSYCTIAKIDDKTGNIIWHKQYFTERQKIQGLLSIIKTLNYFNGNLYTLVDHFVSERENPNDLSRYVMFAKFDLQGNLIWKRLFSNWYLSNRAYSLTPIDDGFLICGDSKDSTHAKGDSDAWLIKTDSNGCIIPGCNAKDNVVQIINPEKVFTVYPNPAQNEINVSTENLNVKIESLAIYNMQGQALKTVSKTTKINTEDLANGNYLLIITTNKQQMAGKKFVVER